MVGRALREPALALRAEPQEGLGATRIDPARGAAFCPHCGYDLRRDAPIKVGRATFDQATGLTVDGSPVHLTVSERIVVQSLIKAHPAWVSREALLNRTGTASYDRGIDAFIKRIRGKLTAIGAAELVQTGYGLGYRWCGEA